MRSRIRTKTILHISFVVLILIGIAMKRLFDHPEWLPVFHIAALLVLIATSVFDEKKQQKNLLLLIFGTAFVPTIASAQPLALLAGLHEQEVTAIGQRAYARYCVGCHGEKGDGQGSAAAFLSPRPRDFTRGLFKFRTTPWGTPPTDDDLFRTISEGVHGTSMQPWKNLPEIERWGLVRYIKQFAPIFEDPDSRGPQIVIPVPPDSLKDEESIRLGRSVFQVIGCRQCHGDTGGGDGPSSGEMKDDWGDPIKVTSFQRGVLRGGRTPKDIYRTIATGISGTPMPGFGESLPPDKIWALVSYVRKVIKLGQDPAPTDVVAECAVWDTCEPAQTQGRN